MMKSLGCEETFTTMANSLLARECTITGDGTRVGDISAGVEAVLKKAKLGIIRELVGHGVGLSMHME